VHLIADAQGYYLAGTATVPGAFASLAPARILDTRVGNGAPARAVPARGSINLTVSGRGGVPTSGASAVVLNVTVTAPTTGGYLTVYPGSSSRPTASSLDFIAKQTIPNAVTVKIGAGGQVTLYNGSSGTVQLIADVAGYYLSGTPTMPGTFVAVDPTRVLDTRHAIGTPTPAGPVDAQGKVIFAVAGVGPVPASGAAAVALNLTVTAPSAPGYLALADSAQVGALPSDLASIPTSNLNFATAQTIANSAIVPLTIGPLVVRNGSTGTSHVIADIAGWFLA